MSTLTLATLDNDAVENHTETQINKLFPKCRPRSDINLNPIIHHPQLHQQQQIERTTAIDNTPSIHLINADRSSDRIIEIAGGREIYSQNRIKAARKSRGSTSVATVSIAAANGSSFDTAVTNNIDLDQSHESSSITKVVANSHSRVYKSPVRHNGNVWELRAKEVVGPKTSTASSLPQTRGKRRLPAPAAGLTETVFSAEVVMTRELDVDNTDLDNDQSAVAAQAETFPGEDLSPENAVVVFDDIDENNGCWYHHRQNHNHGHDENIVDVLMDNEQEEQQHQRRMYHYRRPQNNGLDLRIDLTEVDVARSQSTQQQTIYQTDNMLLDVQREETRIGAQKVIGNLPIAVYEGSPRRYGSYRQSTFNDPIALKRDVSPVDGSGTSLGRHSSNSNSSTGSSISSDAVVKRDRDRSDESHCGNSGGYGLGSNMAYMPRPGFPQRVIYTSTGSNGGVIRSNDSVRSSTQYVDKLSQSNMIHGSCSPSSPIMTEPIDSTTSAVSIPATTFDYLYEFSETRKVLEEFFKCPGPPDITTTISTEDISDHLDMDFKLDTDTDAVALGQYATKCVGATTAIGGAIHGNNLDNEDGVCTEDDDLGTVGKLNFEFQELEYELRRQARSSGSTMVGMYDTATTESSSGEVSGNAYVGQRLAKVRMESGDGAEFCDTSPSPIKHQVPHEQETTEHENNFLDLSVGTGSSEDLGETEVGLQVGHSRNFTLSPETTDCDSNCGDLDSEVSLMLMDNDLGPASGFLGSSGDLVLPGDSLRLYSSMPVLEDGLSSGHASDTDNNNPTVRLMKKQITEIERELSTQTQTIGGSTNTKHGHQQENGLITCTGSLIGIRSGLSPKNENNSPMNGCSSNSYESNHLSGMDSSDKTPPPPAPVPHRCDSGISSGEVDSHNPSNLMVLPASGAHVSGSNLSSKSNCSSSSLSGNNGSNGNNSNIVVLLDNPCHITTNGGGAGNSSNSNSIVEAAIKDIRLTLQRTKTLPLKCHIGTGLPMNGQQGEDAHVVEGCPSPNGLIAPGGRLVDRLGVGSAAAIGALSTNDCERDETTTIDVRDGMNMASPVWVPRQREIATPNIAGDSDHKVPSSEEGGDEEEADTDLETDRLLGQQRTDDQGFYDDKDKESKKKSRNKEGYLDHAVLIEGVLFRARYLGSTQLVCEGQPTKTTRMMQAEEAVSRIKALAPDGETQPSTEVDLFISTEKIMVLNTDLKEIMMDHALRTISYIADIGDLVVLMARRRFVPHELEEAPKINRTPKMICHVFESEEAQFIAQSIGQAFQVAYMEFLKANGIEDHSFVKEMDYQEVLNSQEIFGDELQMFAKKEMQKEVVVPKAKGEILGVVIVESGWGSMLPTVVIANLAPAGAAARCGQLNIGDQIIAINGVSLVGLPLSTCQTYIKNSKNQTVVKLTVVPCAPVVEVKIKRPDTKYQLGFSVQNGVICSLLRGGIAERGGVRVGHRIIEINNQSVVAVPHEKIVNLLATSVGEILMKTMPTSMFRLLTGQENPVYI